jgi:hypothetical protein
MKLCVQILLCSGLLLVSWHGQSAHNLSSDLSNGVPTNFNNEIAKAGVNSLASEDSVPEVQSERSQSTSKFVMVDGTRLHFVNQSFL